MGSITIIKKEARDLLKAYAWILFIDHPAAGAVFLAATFWYPNVGISGLISAIVALLTVRFFKFTFRESGLHIFNAMLVGLSLGAFYQLDANLLFLIIVCGILTVFVTVMLMNLDLKLGTLPVLTTPFVLVAITTAFAAKSYGNLSQYLDVIIPVQIWFSEGIDAFFISLGSIFFTPHPLVGAFIFLAILWRSRYLALLCLTGFIVGFNIYTHFSATNHPELAIFNGFNFSLTAMALGAIYTVPGKVSFAIAIVGAAIAALITAAAQSFMALYGLPVMAIPFLLTTLTILSALSARQSLSPPWLRLENPDLPEHHYERARITKERIGDINSVPMLAPFFGSWQIYQGFNGRYTHQAPWQYALDFIMTEENKSYHDKGYVVEDYHCFGLPIVSPVYGKVVRTTHSLSDNIPGEVDVKNNWGNFILIRLQSGLYVLLAHLKKNSIKVNENDEVTPGQVIAACGNSGRSPQPHLHLQVQETAFLGSKTFPFHISSIILENPQQQEFKLVYRPKENDIIKPVEPTAELAAQLHLPVGRLLCYNFYTQDSKEPAPVQLSVTLSLLGEFRLQSDSGASIAFQEANGMLAFFDRTGPRDKLLDMWTLAMGITPFSNEIDQWNDSPSASLIPLSISNNFIYKALFPLGTGLQSTYNRSYNKTEKTWLQQGRHELKLGLSTITVETIAKLTPSKGCEYLELKFNDEYWTAKLHDIGQVADIGMPAWEVKRDEFR